MGKQLVRMRQVCLWVGMGWALPTHFGAEFFGVDHQQHETMPACIKGIRDFDDLLLCRAVDESFRLQAGRAVFAGFLRNKPLSTGC